MSGFIFGRYFKDSSNKDKKYLRTKIRHLKKPLSDSGINYEQIVKSINRAKDDFCAKTEIVKDTYTSQTNANQRYYTLDNKILKLPIQQKAYYVQ